MALMALPFDGILLWVRVCFLGLSALGERVFEEDFGLDGKEILSVD